MILTLAGGVGGARLALGLARVLGPSELMIVGNVGDDFEHLGLHISPDLDTVMYTLAGVNDRERGWGRSNESWSFMAAIEQLGGETWFNLGDRDLAVHIERTRRLAAGASLSEVTRHLCAALHVNAALVPATDAVLRTVVVTEEGDLPMQRYFVEHRCRPKVQGFRYEGSAAATPAPAILSALIAGSVSGVVICPSNPWLSIEPILAVGALREALERSSFPIVAVSPIVGGAAVKGPAAKIMQELGLEVSPAAIAAHYGRLVDGWVVDDVDRDSVATLAASGCSVRHVNTLMSDASVSERLAKECIDLLERARRTVRRQ